MSGRVRAVTFDFWNTLMVPRNDAYRAARTEAVTEVLADAGVELTEEDLDRHFATLFERFNESWAANRQFTGADAAALLLELVGDGLGPARRGDLTDAFLGAGSDLVPELAPGADAAVRALDAAGIRLGIICDVGMTPSPTLRRYLDHHGLLSCFDHWSFSDEVGVYKPHERIFEHALEGLGDVAPAEAAHVGDLRRTDVAGARTMGMVSVRYRGVHDDTGDVGDAGELVEADHVVEDHERLPPLLLG